MLLPPVKTFVRGVRHADADIVLDVYLAAIIVNIVVASAARRMRLSGQLRRHVRVVSRRGKRLAWSNVARLLRVGFIRLLQHNRTAVAI